MTSTSRVANTATMLAGSPVVNATTTSCPTSGGQHRVPLEGKVRRAKHRHPQLITFKEVELGMKRVQVEHLGMRQRLDQLDRSQVRGLIGTPREHGYSRASIAHAREQSRQ